MHPDARQENLAVPGEFRTLPTPFEQPHSKNTFQFLQGFRHRRLTERQRLGGFGKALSTGNLKEAADVP